MKEWQTIQGQTAVGSIVWIDCVNKGNDFSLQIFSVKLSYMIDNSLFKTRLDMECSNKGFNKHAAYKNAK